jgi:hypothetical protein
LSVSRNTKSTEEQEIRETTGKVRNDCKTRKQQRYWKHVHSFNRRKVMKRKLTAILLASMLTGALLAGCGGGTSAGTQSSPAADNAGSAVSEAGSGAETVTPDAGAAATETAAVAATAAETAKTDEELAAECAALIDKIYVQERTDTTDADIAAA